VHLGGMVLFVAKAFRVLLGIMMIAQKGRIVILLSSTAVSLSAFPRLAQLNHQLKAHPSLLNQLLLLLLLLKRLIVMTRISTTKVKTGGM